MSETEERAERILPTEPGWWWCQPYFGCQPEIREVWLSSREGRGLVFYREVDGTSDESERVGHGDGVTWLCRVPAPEQLAEKDAYIAELEEVVERLDEADEQLAAQAAQVAAGQALADHLREKEAMRRLFLRPFPAGLSEAFLAAFPARYVCDECGYEGPAKRHPDPAFHGAFAHGSGTDGDPYCGPCEPMGGAR